MTKLGYQAFRKVSANVSALKALIDRVTSDESLDIPTVTELTRDASSVNTGIKVAADCVSKRKPFPIEAPEHRPTAPSDCCIM